MRVTFMWLLLSGGLSLAWGERVGATAVRCNGTQPAPPDGGRVSRPLHVRSPWKHLHPRSGISARGFAFLKGLRGDGHRVLYFCGGTFTAPRRIYGLIVAFNLTRDRDSHPAATLSPVANSA